MENNKLIRVNNRVVGIVLGNTFIKKVRGSVHFLRTPPAIAFDIKSLDKALEAGATRVLVIDKETGREYRSSIANIHINGLIIERGFGKQIAVSLEHWTDTVPDKQPGLF